MGTHAVEELASQPADPAVSEGVRHPGMEHWLPLFHDAMATLFDYLPDNALLFVDESHATIPQLGGMYKGDRSRKETLVAYGFRLPSALDNRPLRFDDLYNSGAP